MITHLVSLQGTIKAEAHVWGEQTRLYPWPSGQGYRVSHRGASAVGYAVLLLRLHQDPLGRHVSAALSSLSAPRQTA